MYLKRIGTLRCDRDVEQAEIAQFIGVTQSAYSDYENGKVNIPSDLLVRIAEFYHVTVEYLTGADEFGTSKDGIQPGLYRHFKGKEYQVLFTARHSETQEQMVVYQALYGERGIWVRPAAMWDEQVERDGYSGKRFEYLGV